MGSAVRQHPLGRSGGHLRGDGFHLSAAAQEGSGVKPHSSSAALAVGLSVLAVSTAFFAMKLAMHEVTQAGAERQAPGKMG